MNVYILLEKKNPNKRNHVCQVFRACFSSMTVSMYHVSWFRAEPDLLDFQFGGWRALCCAAEQLIRGPLKSPSTNSAAHARISKPTVSLCNDKSLCWAKGLHLILVQRILHTGKVSRRIRTLL